MSGKLCTYQRVRSMAEYKELFGKSYSDKTVGLEIRFNPSKEEREQWHKENDFRIQNRSCLSPLNRPVVPKAGSFQNFEGDFEPYNYADRKCEMCGDEFPAHMEWETMCFTCSVNWLNMRDKVWELDNEERLQIMRKEEQKRKLEMIIATTDFQLQLELK